MKQYRSVVLALLLGMVLSSAAFGGSKKKPSPPPQSQSPTITSVTANSITVIEGKMAKTLLITQFTEINVNGLRATAADLKRGMTVSFVISTDATKASRINATGK
jgi:hypothetical protein